MADIRVRIAPSPTGFFHIGNAKTALVNWLVARRYGGTFILRLEDTDTERSKPEYAEVILDALHWLGIHWDEGPGIADEPERGDCGPYRQSKRRELHLAEAERLVTEGKAYRCYHTPEELEAMREKARASGERFVSRWRDASHGDLASAEGRPCSIRFRVEPGETVIDDLVQGTVRFDHKEIDDFVIVKPNGDPIFHLAVVVDDGHMQVTHVLRGDDHLTNCARHVMLFNALGYDLPKFGHLPMVLDDSGKKYSKRAHGANILDWRADGYLPETMMNYLVLLGWTPKEENRELFTRDELVERFDIDRLGPSAGKFDRKKLDWLNGQHIRMLPVDELRDRLVPILEAAGFDLGGVSQDWLTRMTAVCQEKLATLNDIVMLTDFFFVEPAEYEEKAFNKHWKKDGAVEKMRAIRELLANTEPFTHEALHEAYKAHAEAAGAGMGQFIHPTRLALTGKSVGPGLFELAELLGRETCLRRVDQAMPVVEAATG
jgi:glutamyl-tRNA synthetase